MIGTSGLEGALFNLQIVWRSSTTSVFFFFFSRELGVTNDATVRVRRKTHRFKGGHMEIHTYLDKTCAQASG